MRIEGTFLRSRVGRRIFVVLLLAAAVPILLFGALSYRALNTHADNQSKRQLASATKYSAMGVLGRLVAARTVLELLAGSGRTDASARLGNGRGQVLAGVAAISFDGDRLAGQATQLADWDLVAVRNAFGETNDPTRLFWRPATEASPARVLVAVRAGLDRTIWLGEVDNEFLFGQLAADVASATVCVFDAQLRPLTCPGTAIDPAQRLVSTVGTEHAVGAGWALFLRSDFGADDWTFVAIPDAAVAREASVSIAYTAFQGAIATLLIVTLLSLIQVRRTTVPLERLIAGTRRLARNDFAARVDLSRSDEFGELASSFNHMAERVGGQIEAMQVQSTIDREILDRLDLPKVMRQVALRIEHLLPQAQVALVQFDVEAVQSVALHRPHESAVLALGCEFPQLDRSYASQDDWHEVEAPLHRGWSERVFQRAVEYVHCLPVVWHGQRLACVLVGQDQPLQLDPDRQREIGELRDRVAVALSAASRERQLVDRAVRDSLTGLHNRAGLHEAVQSRLTQLQDQDDAGLNWLFIDLDCFKDINDTLGHQAGDELLCIAAQRLRACAPEPALVARPGGDEFVVVIEGSREQASALADAVCAHLAEPIAMRNQLVHVGASVGLARYPEHGQSTMELMRCADLAMYEAKSAGRGRQHWYAASLDRRFAQRAETLRDLRLALPRSEFELVYQPRLSVASGRTSSAEALLRWHHPTRGMLPPLQFIELLEETEMMQAVGHWVLQTALRQLRTWRDAGLMLDRMAVNVSVRQLDDPLFVDDVLQVILDSGLAPDDVELEITERLFVGDKLASTAALQRLRQAGVHIAIDDFGTGFSSLSYLHRLPVDVLKVDRSFVMQFGTDEGAEAVTRAIVALAQALGKSVVAEGVETQVQAQRLAELGCDELQGFLYSRPLSARRFAQCYERGFQNQELGSTVF